MYGGIAYTAIDSSVLRSEVSALRDRTAKMAQLNHDLQRVGYEHMDAKINELVMHQNQAAILADITAYAGSLQVVASSILLKHKQLSDYQPTSELGDYFVQQKLVINYSIVDDALYLAQPTKTIDAGMAVINYVVPIRYTEAFEEFSFDRYLGCEGLTTICSHRR